MHRRLTWPLLQDAITGTIRISAMVVFILINSRVFSLVFQDVEGGKRIEHMRSSLPGGQIGLLIPVNVFVFFLAFSPWTASRSPSSSSRSWPRSPTSWASG